MINIFESSLLKCVCVRGVGVGGLSNDMNVGIGASETIHSIYEYVIRSTKSSIGIGFRISNTGVYMSNYLE